MVPAFEQRNEKFERISLIHDLLYNLIGARLNELHVVLWFPEDRYSHPAEFAFLQAIQDFQLLKI